MAKNRSCKIGLDYFSFDVDFFEDDKIQYVSARFGIKGEIVTIKLLCKIYRSGYFIPWGEDEAVLFAKRAGQEFTSALVNEVIAELVKRGFFDKTLFNSFKILTSKGIQKRYLDATDRRKNIPINHEYFLLNGNIPLNDNIIKQNANILRQNDSNEQQRKVKERKVKESKVKEEEKGIYADPDLRDQIPYNLISLLENINMPEVFVIDQLNAGFSEEDLKTAMTEFLSKHGKINGAKSMHEYRRLFGGFCLQVKNRRLSNKPNAGQNPDEKSWLDKKIEKLMEAAAE